MLEKLKQAFARRHPSGASAPRVRSRRALLLWRAVLGIAVFLVVFTVVGFFVVPPVARHYLGKELSAALDRQVAIEDIDLNPFSMIAVVKGLSIKERGASEVFASFGELKLNLQAESIYRRAPILREVKLTDPYVHVVRNPDGRTYNFSDLIEKFSRPKSAPSPQPDEEPRFSLNNVQIVNGRIDIDDRPKHARHAVNEINVAIPFLSNLPYRVEDYVQPSFSARVNQTPFSLQGRSKPFKDTLETSVDIEIEKLDIPRYVEYVPWQLGFKVPSGFVNSRLTVSFVRADNHAPVLSVTGSVDVQQLSLTELDGQRLLNLQKIDVPVTAIDVFGRNYEFGTIALQSPEVFVRRDRDGSLNWLAVVPKREASAAPAQAEPGQPMKLAVPEVRISGGQVHVTDLVPEKGFKADMSGIEATLRGFAMPQAEPAHAELALRTSLGETVKYTGSLTLSPLASEGAIEVNQIRLVNYQPYYQDLILYRLEDGIADLTTRYLFAATDQGANIKLSDFNLGLASVRMRKPGENEDFLRAKTAQISNASVDVNKLELSVGEFTTRDGFLNIIRERDGALNATRILPAPEGSQATTGRQGTPWLLTLGARRRAEMEGRLHGSDPGGAGQAGGRQCDAQGRRSSATRRTARARCRLQRKLNETGRWWCADRSPQSAERRPAARLAGRRRRTAVSPISPTRSTSCHQRRRCR